MPEIAMNYAGVAQVEQAIQTASNALGTNLDELRSRLARMQWEGDDRAAYQMHQKDWDDAVNALIQMLPEIRAQVIGAQERFQTNERRGVSRWNG